MKSTDTRNPSDDPADNTWHFDKRIPIALVLAFIVQTVVLVYVGSTWKAETDSRLKALEDYATDNTSIRRRQWDDIKQNTEAGKKLDAQLSGLDERTKAIASQTNRILDLLLRQINDGKVTR